MSRLDKMENLGILVSVQSGRTQVFFMQPTGQNTIAFVSNALRSWVKTLLTGLDIRR